MDPLAHRIAKRFVKTAAHHVVESLKKALDEIEYLPNGVAAWVDGHGGNKKLAAENAKKVKQASGLLSEVIASIPASVEYMVSGIGKFMTQDHLVKGLAQMGIKQVGFETSGRLRPELQGQPKFDKLVGPMYGGPGIVRYETPETYESMSR